MEQAFVNRDRESRPGLWPVEPQFRPSVGVWESVRRHWGLVVLVTLLLVGVAAVIGLTRTPTYKAEARLAVGRIDVSNPGSVSTFATAAQALASQYSRAVNAKPVVDRVARQLRMPPFEVAKGVSGTPIPESPVFKVRAEAKSERRTVQLANSAALALARYTTRLNRSNPDSTRLFKRFKRAALRVNQLQDRRVRLQTEVELNSSAANRRALVETQSAYDTAVLQRETLRQAYQASRQSQAATSLVQVQTRPATASSDRGSVLQLLLWVGLAAGLVAGVGLATLVANREVRRAVAG